MHHRQPRVICLLTVVALASGSLFATTTTTPHKKKRRAHSTTGTAASAKTTAAKTAQTRTVVAHHPVSHLSRLPKKRFINNPWTSPTFADSTVGDSVDGEDLVVRRAAVQALGPYNGTVVVVDPTNGRLLTIVNQKLAFQSGFQPCSTIKVVAALAGLNEGLIEQNTLLRVGRRRPMDLTEALAHSNNAFFSAVGFKLGYDRIIHYAQLFGLGEKAGLDLEGEQAGTLASAPPSDGLGMMTSFGEGIYMTPLELAGLMMTVANGGTLYYLQHPKALDAPDQFVPKVKRQIDVQQWLPVIKPGMMGAVEYGTARRANYNPDEPIFGKTGTCTDGRSPTHLGWFGSYNEVGGNKLVVVVLLTGGGKVNGPVASGVAGAVYRNLSGSSYFTSTHGISPVALISTQSCCR
ncbi:MAG TPA: penicillin-binding transpeptidase domain-containing protein [Bryobacteraceae bacterium]|nr:penicillin-binding transpeptidase domain-containing protein [Bryobacteraceae bacterium]